MGGSNTSKKVDDGTEFFRRIHVIFMNILNNGGQPTSNIFDSVTGAPLEDNITQGAASAQSVL